MAEGDLTVGDRRAVSGPEGSVAYRVARPERYAGLDSAAVVYESCVSPDDAMTRHRVVRDGETGETTLVDYRG